MPYQLSKLLEHPGGITAQTIKAMTAATTSAQKPGSEVYTPEFLREGNSIPIGNDPGKQSFLRSTVIPLGDLNDMVVGRDMGTSFTRTVGKLAARLNPLILSGVETATGTQAETGRKISELEDSVQMISKAAGMGPTDAKGQPMGYSAPDVSRLVHYSPLSRVVGTVADMADQRKTRLAAAGEPDGGGAHLRLRHREVQAHRCPQRHRT